MFEILEHPFLLRILSSLSTAEDTVFMCVYVCFLLLSAAPIQKMQTLRKTPDKFDSHMCGRNFWTETPSPEKDRRPRRALLHSAPPQKAQTPAMNSGCVCDFDNRQVIWTERGLKTRNCWVAGQAEGRGQSTLIR